MKHRITAGSSKPALGCPRKNRTHRFQETLEPMGPAATAATRRKPRGASKRRALSTAAPSPRRNVTQPPKGRAS